MYHPLRYNSSRGGCSRAPCSHLCLAVPGGRRCACPDALTPPKRATHELACDAREYTLNATHFTLHTTHFTLYISNYTLHT